MKHRYRLVTTLALIAAGALVFLSSSRPAVASDERPDEAKALIKLDDDWSKAAGKRDVDLVASFYAETAIAYPPNEPVCIGRAAARKVWANYFSDPSFTMSWKTLHAEVSGELGYTAGSYQDSFKGPDGTMVNEKGKYVCIWKKQGDGTWKAIQDIWNADAK